MIRSAIDQSISLRVKTLEGGMAAADSDVTAEETARIAGDNANANALTDHLADTTDAHDATAVSYVPGGTLVATNVNAAIDELEARITALTAAALLTSP